MICDNADFDDDKDEDDNDVDNKLNCVLITRLWL